MFDFGIKLSGSWGFSGKRKREGEKKTGKERWEKEKLRKFTVEGKKLCLDWNPNVTPEEKFRAALFCPKLLIFILHERLQEWGESYILWELQANYTILISHKTLCQTCSRNWICSSSKHSHIRYNTDHSRGDIYCHIPTNLSGIFNVTKQNQEINNENMKLSNLDIPLYQMLLALWIGNEMCSLDIITVLGSWFRRGIQNLSICFCYRAQINFRVINIVV